MYTLQHHKNSFEEVEVVTGLHGTAPCVGETVQYKGIDYRVCNVRHHVRSVGEIIKTTPPTVIVEDIAPPDAYGTKQDA